MVDDLSELMVRAAWMYYQDGMTHAEIARKLRLNRVKVTRMLQRARAEGLVEIRITRPLPLNYDVARQLERRFDLKEAVVVPAQGLDANAALGRAAADLLLSLLEPDLCIGFGWSSTVSHMAAHIGADDMPTGLHVVDLVGSMVGKSKPYGISEVIAESLHATLHPLPVPVMMQTEAAYQALVNEPSIAATLTTARRANIAVVGIGEMAASNTLVNIGMLQPQRIAAMQTRGAVGEVLLRSFDREGRPIANNTDMRLMGLTLQEILDVPNVIAVAHGTSKVDAIIGAARGGFINTLVTDIATAKSVLAGDEGPAHGLHD